MSCDRSRWKRKWKCPFRLPESYFPAIVRWNGWALVKPVHELYLIIISLVDSHGMGFAGDERVIWPVDTTAHNCPRELRDI